MSAPDIEVRPASSQDYESVCRLLLQSGLPTSDLTSGVFSGFYVATEEEDVVGVGGLEQNGDFALLRSVVVRGGTRRRGIGVRLVRACLSRAFQLSLKAVYLIPNDDAAGKFFAHLGFSPIAREEVPTAIQSLAEFTYLCPKTHPCLHKMLN